MDYNNTTRSPNETSPEINTNFPASDKLSRFLVASLIIVIIIGSVCGNLLVCLAIGLNKRLRKTTNYFIFSLAISDLLTALLSMPFDVEDNFTHLGWRKGEFMCNFRVFMYLIAAPTSLLNLMAVSLDRFFAISWPLKYYTVMKPKIALLVIAMIWLYTLTFTTVGMVSWPYSERSVTNGQCRFNIHPYYSGVNSAVNFILPAVITCVIYFNIYMIARKHAKRIAKQEASLPPVLSCSNEDSGAMTSEKKRISKNIKAAKTIAIIVSTFLLCWMPLTLTSMIGVFCGKKCFFRVSLQLWRVFLVLAYANSAMNPILYSFFNKEFRESFLKLFKLQFRFR